ncbi:MAG: aldehyde dehydrogenase family protein [Sphingobacteriales bacterium]|nr:MAG: aldehyde dehydrogenase family protein [Sphingobacteriales bacterium]
MNFLSDLGIKPKNAGTSTGSAWLQDKSAKTITSYSPANGEKIAEIAFTTDNEYEEVLLKAQEAFLFWRDVPAPQRGEIVRQIGNKLRQYKEPLGKLVSYEMGKIYQEGMGEVQEMIDICDFAVGLSRQLYGLTITSERPFHRMYEQWHPLGIVGIITAFNFPVAVWSWNAILAAVCGDVCIWKPSEKVPLCAVAVQNIVAQVLRENNLPEGIFCLVNGDHHIGKTMAADTRIALISATGSTAMGKKVGAVVAERMGKSLLELGGNNAMILTPSAELDMALRALVFGAAGTAGQRCTTTRRVIIHESIYNDFVERLIHVYQQIKIGNPLQEGVLVGPLIDTDTVKTFKKAMQEVEKQGGKIIFGGEVLEGEEFPGGCYVQPALAEVKHDLEIVQHETFAPLLYLIKYSTLDEAIQIQNNVKQGLSSSIFTQNMREMETFLSARGSDCGIANVNIGTSGAEIGGAFGGEKETGGGRESGSDSWKNYMRRQTNTVNYGASLPLAQGIEFPI